MTQIQSEDKYAKAKETSTYQHPHTPTDTPTYTNRLTHLPGNKNYRGDNTIESRLVQKKMDNINGLNIPKTSTYNKNVSTELHKRFLQVPT